MLVEEGEFKGNPVLIIRFDESDRYPFSFGIGKAKKILSSLEEIKAFVAKHDQPKPQEQQSQEEAASESSEQESSEAKEE